MANRSINFISESIALLSHRVKYVDVFASHRIAGSQREFNLNWDWVSQLGFARHRSPSHRGSLTLLPYQFYWIHWQQQQQLESKSQSWSRSTTKSRTLYKAVNKMCISLNSLSERRLADGSVRWPALHILRPIKMHFAKKFLPSALPPFFVCLRLDLFKLQFCLPDL